MKKVLLIWTIILVVAVIAVVLTTTSLAIWQRNDHASSYIKTDITDENPSLKYQMYVPVKASGVDTTTTTSAYARIAGSFSVTDDKYGYTLEDAAELNNITGFSLAGWYGGVALEYIEVPDEVTVKVNGTDVTKPVVRIKPETDYADYSFGGVNTAISSVIIGENVIEVTQGAFYGMAYLETVSLHGETDIYLYPYCFGGCVELKRLDSTRTTPLGWSTSMITAGSFPLNTVTFHLYDAVSATRSYAVGDTMENWIPTRDDYIFTRWYADAGYTEPVNLYERYAIDGDEYYAEWTERESE